VILETLTYLPAQIVWELARRPKQPVDAETQKSIRKNGWLEKHPARISMQPGGFIRVDNGNHRLAFLSQSNDLARKIPVTIRVQTPY
tara:strand:- start:164 stop:424 length:261 start_codon:yes stop_codon:yes gene_type:complete